MWGGNLDRGVSCSCGERASCHFQIHNLARSITGETLIEVEVFGKSTFLPMILYFPLDDQSQANIYCRRKVQVSTITIPLHTKASYK